VLIIRFLGMFGLTSKDRCPKYFTGKITQHIWPLIGQGKRTLIRFETAGRHRAATYHFPTGFVAAAFPRRPSYVKRLARFDVTGLAWPVAQANSIHRVLAKEF
jgi:hypothetical protein